MDQGDLATRLVESEQKLASVPELEHEIERLRAENERLQKELESALGTLDEVFVSLSWRLTAPLRRLLIALRRG